MLWEEIVHEVEGGVSELKVVIGGESDERYSYLGCSIKLFLLHSPPLLFFPLPL